jgi:hypothetical protein
MCMYSYTILYSENKNKYFLGMMSYLVNHGYVNEVRDAFLHYMSPVVRWVYLTERGGIEYTLSLCFI